MKNAKVYIKDKEKFKKIIESSGYDPVGLSIKLEKQKYFIYRVLCNGYIGKKSGYELSDLIGIQFDYLFEIR